MIIDFFDIAGVKIQFQHNGVKICDTARLFMCEPFEEECGLTIWERKSGRLVLPPDFKRTYVSENASSDCYMSPRGELIARYDLDLVNDSRDLTHGLRLNAEMNFAEVDPHAKDVTDSVVGYMGRFIFECHTIKRGWLPFHSVSVDTGAGALLFSGVSGEGKSTQAELWEREGGARIINGDRAVLIPEGDKYVTAGTPWNGSSGVLTKLRADVRALVFIKQAEKNALRRLTPAEGFEHLFARCSVPYYHDGLTKDMLETINRVICTVPMYYLENRADRECYEITRDAVFGG